MVLPETDETLDTLAERAGVTKAQAARTFLPSALPVDPGDLVELVESIRASVEDELDQRIASARPSTSEQDA